MLWFEHELYPFPYIPEIEELNKVHVRNLCTLPTDALFEEYWKRRKHLEQLRNQEPHMKRADSRAWKLWVKKSHDLRDDLNAIAAELKARKSYSGSHN